ncbi:MAG: CPBP family intramembrane metalloprotease [Ruminococcus sp.]|nr:CPBP family intramembrane metalloprotease [Ruminococcus sp.]
MSEEVRTAVESEPYFEAQSEEYNNVYRKWRLEEGNRYARRISPDDGSHSYVPGQGFVRKTVLGSEENALHNCLFLVGAVLLVMLAFDAAIYFIIQMADPSAAGNNVYFTQRTEDAPEVPMWLVLLVVGGNCLKYVTAIGIFKMRTRLPMRLVMADRGSGAIVSFNATVVMMMVMVSGKLAAMLLSHVLRYVSVDSVYVYMFRSTETPIVLISFVYNCIIFPVLFELLFRGFMLQLMRQFGDRFAVTLVAGLCSLTFYDIPNIFYCCCCSAVLGVYVIRTGSTWTAVYMHSITNALIYILTGIGLINPDVGRVTEIVVFFLICLVTLFMYSRLMDINRFTRNSKDAQSTISPDKKFITVISTTTLAVWFVFSMVLLVLETRFI